MDQTRPTPSVWNTAPRMPAIDQSTIAGKKPNKIIPVPHEYRRQTFARECDTLIHDLKTETGCIVVAHWNQGNIDITSFDIYGSVPGIEKAVRHLHQWISNAHAKSMASSAWAKTSAYNYDKWYYEEVEHMENVKKQRFKGPIPTDNDPDAPKHATTVDWPYDLSSASLSPRDVFGNKLEALDALRMQDKVWITLLPSNAGQWQIEIAGCDAIDIEAAKEHLNTMVSKVRADASGLQHAHNIILDEREGMEVELQQNEVWWPNHTDRVVPRLLPHKMMHGEPGTFRQGVHFTQLAGTRNAFKLALDNIRHRKGTYDFVVRLGSLALSSKHVSVDKVGQTFKRETFLKEINASIDLDVKRWLVSNEAGYLILDHLMSADDILEPTKSAAYFGYTPEKLGETRPTFRGTWVFCDPTSGAVSRPRAPPRHSGRPAPLGQKSANNENVHPPPTSLFVIQVDWTDDEEGQYEKGTPRFYKLEAGKNGPRRNMDVNLLELGESRGWHFALESLISISVKAVPPVITGFAKQVTMKPKYDITSTESFAQWDITPTVKKHLQAARLDSIYCFGIRDTCYKAELTAMWYPQQRMPVWGLAVRHSEWATHLAELERLPVGRQASWGDTMSTFFPDNGQSASCVDDGAEALTGDGLCILTDKLLKLSDIVSSVTPAGGVRL